MKRDGRTLDHATLEEFRLLALRRVKDGEKASAVVRSLGMNRTSIYRWLKAASGRGKGERALASRPATGRPSKLTPTQQARVFRWINGKDPRQYGLDFGLWTRQIAATLIEQKFGVHMGVTAVGRLLARLGLTPQKPLQRAYQRDPQAIERWQRQVYPGIAAAARQSGADIYFWDESGFRADTVHGAPTHRKGHGRRVSPYHDPDREVDDARRTQIGRLGPLRHRGVHLTTQWAYLRGQDVIRPRD